MCQGDGGDSGDAILGPSRSKRESLSFIFSSRVALSGACRRRESGPLGVLAGWDLLEPPLLLDDFAFLTKVWMVLRSEGG